MDPNSSIEILCLVEDNHVSLNDGVKSNGEWDTPECSDTANSGQKKEVKAFTFYRMETEEISERYVAPCFVNGLEFINNPEEDDIEPGVVFGRSFLRSTKGIANFRNGVITIYPDLDPFNDDSDKFDDSKDDWVDILEGIDFGDIPEIEGIELPPFVCKMGRSSRNKKKPSKNYKMKYDDEGPSLTVNCVLTRGELSREELEKDL
ncbi:hypothetical protein Tco_1324986 [Tanacetum coccineum]